jgi:hypothetical protein
MDKNQIKRQIIKVILTCIIFLLLIIFYYHIEKYTTGVIEFFLTVLIPVAFVAISVFLVKGVINIFKYRKQLSFAICLPTLIVVFTFSYLFFSPYRLNSEKLCSEVVLRACFEGTQNQAYILFREDQTFELNWTGVFFANNWYYGNYTQNADTFYLNYVSKKPYRFGDTIVNNGQDLITINKKLIDSSQYFVPFYLGYCKGLN